MEGDAQVINVHLKPYRYGGDRSGAINRAQTHECLCVTESGAALSG